MVKSSWRPVDKSGRLYRAQYQADFGTPWSLLCRLNEVSFMVYSPGPELAESARRLIPDGAKLIIVAPSMGHTMGIKPWLQLWPAAKLVCAETARQRLQEKTGLKRYLDPAAIGILLPAECRLLVPPANSFGELWLRLQYPDEDCVYWGVCDSLMNIPKLGSNPLQKLLLKFYGLGEGLHLHRRFRNGIRDRANFRDWSLQQFQAGIRQVLLPCHGDVFDDSEDRIRKLLQSRI